MKYLPQHVRLNITQTWKNMHATVPSILFCVPNHLCKPHLLPTKLAAVSPIPTVNTPLSNTISVKLLVGIQRGNDRPQSKYMGVNESKESFSSANVANPCCKIPPKGGTFKNRIT